MSESIKTGKPVPLKKTTATKTLVKAPVSKKP
jgi:hypothetical protein